MPTDLTRKYKNFIFGNFRGYYKRKSSKNQFDDERIREIDQKYFLNKDCLDVGCHEGNVTI